jgi:hypothetical protein
VTNPYGYQPQQPGYGGYGHPAAQPHPAPPLARPSGVTAIIAALLGLGGAGMCVYLPTKVLVDLPARLGLADLPGEVYTSYGLFYSAALFLLLGAVLTLFRKTAGGILLLTGSLLVIAALMLEPALLFDGRYGRYFRAVFGFGSGDAWIRFLLMVLAPLTFLLAVLPPTFRYLGYRPPVAGYGPAPGQYPPQGW